MNLNLPSLPRQVAHSPDVSAVVRHSRLGTGWAARRVLGAHPKNNAVGPFPLQQAESIAPALAANSNKINTLAHVFNLSNVSSFHPSRLHRECGRSGFRAFHSAWLHHSRHRDNQHDSQGTGPVVTQRRYRAAGGIHLQPIWNPQLRRDVKAPSLLTFQRSGLQYCQSNFSYSTRSNLLGPYGGKETIDTSCLSYSQQCRKELLEPNHIIS
jgi:hypothetical protein